MLLSTIPITSARRPRQIAAILPAKKVIVALTVQVSKRMTLNMHAQCMFAQTIFFYVCRHYRYPVFLIEQALTHIEN